MRSLNLFDDTRLDSIGTRDRAELYSLSAMVYSTINFRALNEVAHASVLAIA